MTVFIIVVINTRTVRSDPLLAIKPKTPTTKSTIQNIDDSFGNLKQRKKRKKMFPQINHEDKKLSINTTISTNQQNKTQHNSTTSPSKPSVQSVPSAHLFVEDFDSFFNAIPESFFEQTENEMMNILETEKRILKMSLLTSTNSTITNNVLNDTQSTLPPPPSRPRRSALRNGYKTRLIRRNNAVICRRRCVWSNIWHFIRTGVKNNNQSCDC